MPHSGHTNRRPERARLRSGFVAPPRGQSRPCGPRWSLVFDTARAASITRICARKLLVAPGPAANPSSWCQKTPSTWPADAVGQLGASSSEP